MNVSTAAHTDTPTDRLPQGIWKVVSVAAIGSFMAQLDATIVSVSLPSLAKTLHTPFTTIQWTMSGYLLALALTLPLCGWLVGRMGAKTVYLWCFAAFTVASALCGLAWSTSSLIVFRILQGMAGGVLAPMAQMTVARVAGKNMPRVASAVTLPVLLAPLLGPVVAGAVLTLASWRWIFLINVPVGLLALVLAIAFLPQDTQEREERPLDFGGLALLCPTLVAFLYGIDHVQTRAGEGSVVAALFLFVLYLGSARRKGDKALIDLRLFRIPAFSASATTMFMMNGVSFAGQMLIPTWLIHSAGVSPTATGWLLAPLSLGMMCTFPFMGQLTDRFGIRGLTLSGGICALLGTAILVLLAPYRLNIAAFSCALFLRGAGIGTIGIPAMSTGYRSVAKADLPMATTALNIVQRIGGPTYATLCATALGWCLSGALPSVSTSGAYVLVFGLLCGLHALLCLATLGLPKRLPQQ